MVDKINRNRQTLTTASNSKGNSENRKKSIGYFWLGGHFRNHLKMLYTHTTAMNEMNKNWFKQYQLASENCFHSVGAQ